MKLFGGNKNKTAPKVNTFKEPEKPKAKKKKKASKSSSKVKIKLPQIKVASGFSGVLKGNFLTGNSASKNLPFILFITLLLLLYIGNSYYAERKERQLDDVTEEIKELRYKYVSGKSDLMNISNHSQVDKRLNEEGIRNSVEPPKKIFIDKNSK